MGRGMLIIPKRFIPVSFTINEFVIHTGSPIFQRNQQKYEITPGILAVMRYILSYYLT